jgi:hypothetical protein
MRSLERKVFAPLVAAGVKEGLHTARQRIDSAQIRTFVEVTAMACERKVINIVGTTMLPCNHVLHVMHEFAIVLVKAAIFASLSSPLTDEPPGPGIHR